MIETKHFFLILVFYSLTGCLSGSSAVDEAPPSTNTEAEPPSDGTGGTGGPNTDGGNKMLNVVSIAERDAYFTTFLADYTNVFEASNAGNPTELSTLPDMGAVTYVGHMRLLIANPKLTANVIGDMELSIDIQTAQVSGEADGFLGQARSEEGRNEVAHYDGVISASNGAVFLRNDDDDTFSFDIEGNLDNGLNTFGVSGNLVGSLYGEDAEGLLAIGMGTGFIGSLTTTVDGEPALDNVSSATVSAVKSGL